VIVGGVSALVAGLAGWLVLRARPSINREYTAAMEACAAESTTTVRPADAAGVPDVDLAQPADGPPRQG
jgi:hypothetical protein